MYALAGITTTSANFNSTRIPGVCKPMDFATLNVVQDFQRQLNRVASVSGFPKIAPDGDIGPSTLALFRSVAGIMQIPIDTSSCINVAADVDVYAEQVKRFADAQGAPSSVASPKPAMAPTIVTRDNVLVPQSAAGSIVDSFQNMGTLEKVAIAGTVGAIGFVVWDQMKRKKKRGGRK